MIDRAIDSELVQRDRERLLVYVSATANPTRTVRAAAELARAFDCEWLAVRVDSPVALGGSSHDRRVTSRALRLAARLGAEITELTSLEP